eukprot:9120841-Lingulodinium_polyedra.AAC.1
MAFDHWWCLWGLLFGWQFRAPLQVAPVVVPSGPRANGPSVALAYVGPTEGMVVATLHCSSVAGQ